MEATGIGTQLSLGTLFRDLWGKPLISEEQMLWQAKQAAGV